MKTRRDFLARTAATAALTTLAPGALLSQKPKPAARRASITDFGAVPDGTTLNTTKIQAAIDHLAAQHGGTLIIPKGTFLTGAIFLKPAVHLHLEQGAVLKGSTDTAHYPTQKTRIEGHFQDWLPALLNADHCDGLRIDGEGTLDGSGAPFWKAFWTALAADRKTANLDVPRPRLALIENSRDVQIRGITFKDSGFWNLHLYRCQNVLIENMRFEVPDGERCPSTDGTDIDSCQNVTVRGCTYRVDDDGVCLKGSKGPFAMDDKDSPAVEHIRVENTVFERSHGVVTCGSEATVIRDVIVENCTVHGRIPVVRLKLRPDTPQLYEDIHYRNITLSPDKNGAKGEIFDVRPWRQYFDLKGQPPPKATARNVTITGVKGTYGSFGVIKTNPGQTSISNFKISNVDVTLDTPNLTADANIDIAIDHVTVNGKPLELTRT